MGRRRLTIALSVAALALLAGVLGVGFAHQDGASSQDKLTLTEPPVDATAGSGHAAPALSGRSLDGARSVDLARERGRVVVVNFWAAWCVPCRSEAPALRRFAAAHPDVVMIGVDRDDTADAGLAFARKIGITWSSVYDPDHAIADRWRVIGLPWTFVVDPRGRIAFQHPMAIDEQTLAGLTTAASRA